MIEKVKLSDRYLIIHEYDKIEDEIIYGVIKKNLRDLENIFEEIKVSLKK